MERDMQVRAYKARLWERLQQTDGGHHYINLPRRSPVKTSKHDSKGLDTQ